MSKFRTKIKPSEREEGFEEVREKVAQSRPLLSVTETQDSLKLDEILAKRDSAREKVMANKGNIKLRQEWVFYEALYRDTKYSTRGRGWLRQLGWDGTMEEVYGGARTGVDAALDDE